LLYGITRLTARSLPKAFVFTPLVMAALTALIAIYDMVDVQSHISDLESDAEGLATASIGVGLWMVLIGAVLSAAAGVVLLREPTEVLPVSASTVETV
jgi:hypothetical protein